jgi:8-oxo-dGTP pyrophosphatase MutT (NUDIX family)
MGISTGLPMANRASRVELLSPTGALGRKYVEGFPSSDASSIPYEPNLLLAGTSGIAHSSDMGLDRSAKGLRLLRAPKKRQEVAAVCYRIGKGGVEFLLVQTRGGRWIFPKGGVEAGLTHAESAALEAFEEAGVHGRMEAIAFARYFRKPGNAEAADPGVRAHLCEVSRLESPQESNRKPTWFSAGKAKQCLLKDRAADFGGELARVIDRAVSRIERLGGRNREATDSSRRDPLQKVSFEAFEEGRLRAELADATLARYLVRKRYGHSPSANRQALRLGTGSGSEPGTNITAIDSKRRTGLPKAGK